jgi:intracellular septation protein A
MLPVARGQAVFATSRKVGRVDTSGEDRPAARKLGGAGGRIRAIAMIVIFDVAAPLAAYSLLRSGGMTTVSALLLSGVFPALGLTITAIRSRRLDAVGALVLAGIVVGTILGLVFHSARLLLIEGSVPTAIFGVACLGSLRARRPLMYSFALELTGPDTKKGREMTGFWQFEEFRHIFRIITAVWGAGFLIEAALRVVIVYNTSTGTALAISKVSPYVTAAILSGWTIAYSAHLKRKGERAGTTTGEKPEPRDADASSANVTNAPNVS